MNEEWFLEKDGSMELYFLFHKGCEGWPVWTFDTDYKQFPSYCCTKCKAKAPTHLVIQCRLVNGY